LTKDEVRGDVTQAITGSRQRRRMASLLDIKQRQIELR